jgi:hypothetical protein
VSHPRSEEFSAFMHATWHLQCRRGQVGYSEQTLIVECWGYPVGEVPAWAIESAAAGEHPSSWCPQLNPALAHNS